MKAVAWTEQRLKQSAIPWLSAELHCWESHLRLCTTLLSAWLLAVPASMSFWQAKERPRVVCLQFLPALCIVKPVQSAVKILQKWQLFVVEPEINGFIQ